MGYRDDREALLQRAETAESDRASAERKLSSAEQELQHHQQKDLRDEAQLRELQKEVSQLRQRLGIEPSSSPSASNKALPFYLALGVVVVLITAGTLFFAVKSSPGPSPSRGSQSAQPAVVEPAVSSEDVASPPVLPRQPTDVLWFGGFVTSESGGRVRVDDPCLVRVVLLPRLGIGSVIVRCGETSLYNSADPLGTAMQMNDRHIAEIPASVDGALAYTVRYVDTGTRTGTRAQVAMDSTRHQLRVFSDGASPFSVSIFVNDVSFPRWGAEFARPLSRGGPRSTGSPLHMIARPLELTGPAPESIQEARDSREGCELQVRTSSGSYNCRAALRCGSQLVYGAGTSGLNMCSVIQGVLGLANDDGNTQEDGDPTFRLNLEERRVTVTDMAAGAPWSATFELVDHPGCELERSYQFESIDGMSETPGFRLTRDGEQATVTWPEGTGHTGTERGPLEVRCSSGLLNIGETTVAGEDLVPGTYRAQFGPGFSTLGGRRSSAVDGVFAGVISR